MADYNSGRQCDARRACGDAEASRRVHGRMAESFNVDIRRHGAMRTRAVVLGALAGLCAAAAVVPSRGGFFLFSSSFSSISSSISSISSSISSGPSPPSFRLFVSWAVAGGLGLALCATVAHAHERAVYELELRRELWEIDNHLAGELLEMIAIYRHQGLTAEEAHTVTRVFARQKPLFAALMMVEELGYSRLEPPTAAEAARSAALPAAIGYTAALLTPLLPLLRRKHNNNQNNNHQNNIDGGTQQRLATALLGLGTIVVSYLQSEVFFGAYASAPIFCKIAAINTAGVGAIYALSFWSAKVL